ncbi:MAG: ion transporter [Pseudomonadota bacterium]
MQTLSALIASPRTERALTVLIIINAVVLGLETDKDVMARFGPLLLALDTAILSVFVVELFLKLVVQRLSFFKSAWNVFDFVVIAIALVPASGPLAVLRALRILRVLRLVTVMPSLKRVVSALLGALPGMGSIVLLLTLIFYVGAVMATKLFGDTFPEWFGSLFASTYTLFQIMTLESWSMGIVRPVMDQHPFAWAFFVPFILCTTFTALNLFIGVVVQAMQDGVAADEQRATSDNQQDILHELQALRSDIADLKPRQPPAT